MFYLNRYRWERIDTCLLRSCLLQWTWAAWRPSNRWISTQWPWCYGRSFHVVRFQVNTTLSSLFSHSTRLLLAVFPLEDERCVSPIRIIRLHSEVSKQTQYAKTLTTSQLVHHAGAYPGFRSTKRLLILLGLLWSH